ncbi:Uncharacterised protein [Klebsiella pneumoniae]|nr:Uncharacterised protein [Klebsiella pneumoniae]
MQSTKEAGQHCRIRRGLSQQLADPFPELFPGVESAEKARLQRILAPPAVAIILTGAVEDALIEQRAVGIEHLLSAGFTDSPRRQRLARLGHPSTGLAIERLAIRHRLAAA